MATVTELTAAVRQLRPRKPLNAAARQQAVVLLWAIGRARRGLPRLDHWSTAEQELAQLLSEHGDLDDPPTPEYPFVALADTAFWELSATSPPLSAIDTTPLPWLTAENPRGGLRQEVYDQLGGDDETRAAVVGAVIARFFKHEPVIDLLRSFDINQHQQADQDDWQLAAGDLLRRGELHRQFGGQQQGGISTPHSGKHVFLITNDSGEQYGYRDGWQDDGRYHYTGQGTLGDQWFTSNNSAVLDPHRRAHVFAHANRTILRHVGEFRPDAERPYYRDDAPDDHDDMRSVLIFRLVPVTATARPPKVQVTVQPHQPGPKLISLESNKTQTFVTNPSGTMTAVERREADLVDRYSDWLQQQGRTGVATRSPCLARPDRSTPTCLTRQPASWWRPKGLRPATTSG